MDRTLKAELTNMCLVKDKDGRVLLQMRTKHDWPGWTLPGGHVEKGENLVQSVIREVKEETGLTIKDLKLVGVNNNVSPNFNRYLVFLFKTKTFSGELKSSEEGKVFWVEKKNLKNYKLTPEFSDLIEIFYNDSINENYAVWDDKGEVKDHLL